MAFAVANRYRGTMGALLCEVVTFTELNTDTGGTFVTSLSTVLAVNETVNGNFASSSSFSGRTITIGNAAGPTSGSVLVIGY